MIRLMWPLRTFVLLFAVSGAAPARAQEAPAVVAHPIYAHMPGSAHNDHAHRLFKEAVARYGMGPVEVMDIPGPAAPKAAELLRTGMAATEKLKFAEAEAALDAAVAEVLTSGGAGLTTAALSDLFLYQAIAAQKATWKELEAAITEIAPPKAKEAYLRAAVLTPDRVLERRRQPPLAIASFQLATAEVKQRPRGKLVVRAASSAEITVDAGPVQIAPATSTDLPFGEHFVRVEDVGHQPWVAAVVLAAPTLEIDAPATAPLTLDDRQAAVHARQMGAAFALVAALVTGPKLSLELHLIDATSGETRDSVVIPFGGEAGALDAAVMRLDEEARRLELVKRGGTLSVPSTNLSVGTVPPSVSPPPPSLADDPGAWARKRWPLLTAIGAALGTAIVLGIAVAADSR